MRVRVAVGIGLIPLWVSSLLGQGVVRGIVRQDSTGSPLAEVEVLVSGAERRTATDSSGRFFLRAVPRGSYLLLFRRPGYYAVQQAIRVEDRDTVWVNPFLSPAAFPLPGLETRGEVIEPAGAIGIEGFEERRRMGFGDFIEPATLRKEGNLRLIEVLRRHTRIYFFLKGNRYWATTTRKPAPITSRNFVPEPCPMQFMLDGQILPQPDFHAGFYTDEIEAIEVYYGGAGIPPQFSGARAECGTIVMWTRRSLYQPKKP